MTDKELVELMEWYNKQYLLSKSIPLIENNIHSPE